MFYYCLSDSGTINRYLHYHSVLILLYLTCLPYTWEIDRKLSNLIIFPFLKKNLKEIKQNHNSQGNKSHLSSLFIVHLSTIPVFYL